MVYDIERDMVDLQFGPAKGPGMSFRSYQQLYEFIHAEAAAWEGMREAILRRGDSWYEPAKTMFRTLTEVEMMLSRIIRGEASPTEVTEMKAMLERLAAIYVTSKSPEGQAILQAGRRDIDIAALLLTDASRQDVTFDVRTSNNYTGRFNLAQVVGALVAYELNRNGIPDQLDRQAGLDAVQRGAQAQFERLRGEVDEAHLLVIGARAELEDQRKTQDATLKAMHEAFEAGMEAEKKRAEEQVAEARKVFLEDIRIQGAVEYWRGTARTARQATWWHLGAFVVVAALAVAGMVVLMGRFIAVDAAADDMVGPPPWNWPLIAIALKDLGLIGTALLSLPVVLLLWVLKHLARGYIDAKRTAADALHRATLIETYLALVKDKDAQIDEKVRLLMLGAIFSHPGAGNDADSYPATIVDALLKGRG